MLKKEEPAGEIIRDIISGAEKLLHVSLAHDPQEKPNAEALFAAGYRAEDADTLKQQFGYSAEALQDICAALFELESNT